MTGRCKTTVCIPYIASGIPSAFKLHIRSTCWTSKKGCIGEHTLSPTPTEPFVNSPVTHHVSAVKPVYPSSAPLSVEWSGLMLAVAFHLPVPKNIDAFRDMYQGGAAYFYINLLSVVRMQCHMSPLFMTNCQSHNLPHPQTFTINTKIKLTLSVD